VVMEKALPNSYEMDEIFETMTFTVDTEPARIAEGLPEPLPHVEGAIRIREVKDRGFLRVGYFRDRLPFAYRNTAGEVVGYDAEMAHMLAMDLGVELEFARIDRGDFFRALNENRVDLIMSGSVVTTERLLEMAFSEAYMTQTVAFIVPDHLIQDFSTVESLAEMDSLTVGTHDDPFIKAAIRRIVPQASFEDINSPRSYLRGEQPHLDAVVYSAQAGSAWCLIYPQYAVAVPQPLVIEAPTAYPVAGADPELAEFISQWIELKRSEGYLDQLYEHWILGKEARKTGPRWSIMRDVLGWVE
jgi:ABC-type amino acid transport substrate-binding protein